MVKFSKVKKLLRRRIMYLNGVRVVVLKQQLVFSVDRIL